MHIIYKDSKNTQNIIIHKNKYLFLFESCHAKSIQRQFSSIQVNSIISIPWKLLVLRGFDCQFYFFLFVNKLLFRFIITIIITITIIIIINNWLAILWLSLSNWYFCIFSFPFKFILNLTFLYLYFFIFCFYIVRQL